MPLCFKEAVDCQPTFETDIYYFNPDHLGSSAYISNAAGVVTQHMEYLPFGETMVDEHTNSFNSPFKYNGKEFDEETGNYYYSARYYDPKWSIFISVDPLAEQTMDAYGYCYQNPVNLTDPSGMSASPIFDYQGNYLGNDNQGFNGEVIFMDPAQFELFGGGDTNTDGSANKNSIDHETALALGATLDEITSDNMSQGEIDMVNEAINFIVTFTDGVSIDRSKLHNGKTSSSYHYIGKDAQGFQSMFLRRGNDGSGPSDNGKLNFPAWVTTEEPHVLTYNLTSPMWSAKEQFTVSNIQNTFVHEWDAHVKHKVPGEGFAHSKAYHMQKNHSSWSTTTPFYKSKIEGGLKLMRD